MNKLFLSFLIFLSTNLYAQTQNQSWRELVKRQSDEWYKSDEAKMVAENVLLYQREIGGWPKNIQMQNPISDEEKQKLLAIKSTGNGATTDNGATSTEMLFLSKIYKVNPDVRYKEAFLKALNYLLIAQYENGGWPQFYPLQDKYSTHITYNDDSQVNVMKIMENIYLNNDVYSVEVDDETRNRCKMAFDKGVDCILKTQWKQNGVLTAWCAQYDEKTLQPANARAYELISLSAKESSTIVLLLMTIDNPSQEIKNSINGAIAWFEKTKITGIRQEVYKTDAGVKEKRLVPDSTAAPLWARFVDIDTNVPFFCDRDGVKKASMFEIGQERRAGYGWYNFEPNEALKKYPKWKSKWDK